MIGWVGAAGALVAVAALGSGLLMIQARVARLAGWLLAVAGVTALVGTWLVDRGTTPDAGKVLLVAAWMVALPAALWAYPRPLWHHPVDVVLGVTLVGPGVLACLYAGDGDVLLTFGTIAVVAFVCQTWWRLERSTQTDRRALAWTALTITVVGFVSLAMQFTAWNGTSPAVAVGILAAVPASMAIGVLRPEAVDVRGLVVTATVSLALIVGYVAYFVGALAALEVVGSGRPEPVALAILGLFGGALLHPASSVLHTVMDQLLFGDRPDPLDAATRVVERIGEDPQAALAPIREDLAVPFVALWRGTQLVAQSGEPVSHVRRIVTRTADGDEVTLVVGMRPGDLRLSTGDAQVLRLVAPLLAQLVRSAELSAEVQESRAQALTAIADERRRLRRELHDGLGPTLTGVAFTTDAARNLLPGDPGAAADLLDVVRGDTVDAIDQVRQIVYGMRPPALDELGLVAALRQQSRGLGRPDGHALEVRFVVDAELPALPAAVEVAAYRIVLEALTNVARHSRSDCATVSLALAAGSRLIVDVADDGAADPTWQPGVGISSMRDRATELGGAFSAGPGPHGGRVRAVLPLGA